MDLALLKPLYDHPGPFASVYIDTRRTDLQAPHEIELRWRDLRRQLATEGADASTLAALDSAVGSDRGQPAPQGQALFAAGGELLHLEELQFLPMPDRASFGRLPHVLPMLAQRVDHPPYLLVLADRVGADLEVRMPFGPPYTEQVDGETSPIRKVAPGDWSQDRYQRRVENTWDRNARKVALEVERLGNLYRAGLIVVSGDVRARSLLLEHLGRAWRDRTVELPTGGRAEGADRERADLRAMAAAGAEEESMRARLRERFEHGLVHGGAVHGFLATIEALRRADVDTLILSNAPQVLDAWVWWDPNSALIALHPEDLEAVRAAETHRDRAADVLPRTLAHTSGQLMLVSDGEPGPDGGIGALLRHQATAADVAAGAPEAVNR